MMLYITKQAALESLGEEPYNWNDSPEEIAELATWRACYKAIENLPGVDLTYRFKEGYEQALNDIMEIMDSGDDMLEVMYKIQRFIILHKTGVDIIKMVNNE